MFLYSGGSRSLDVGMLLGVCGKRTRPNRSFATAAALIFFSRTNNLNLCIIKRELHLKFKTNYYEKAVSRGPYTGLCMIGLP